MHDNYTAKLAKIEGVLERFLPSVYNSQWKTAMFSSISPAVKDPHFYQLAEPCRSLVSSGGKRWRPLLLVLCTQLVSVKDTDIERAFALTPLVEFVHTASLIHDDIEDSSDMRRGKPAAHITYGLDTALNAGSWLYFASSACLDAAFEKDSDPSAQQIHLTLYKILHTELRRLHLGQAMDILWHNNNTIVPQVDEYTAMVKMKTGTLASLSAKTGIICGGGTMEQADILGSLASDIGVGFQILDDYINLTSGNKGKKRGDDIIEGKKSLPVLLHLEKKPEDFNAVMSCFNRARIEGSDSSAIEECIAIIEKSDALQEARQLGKNLIAGSCSRILETYNNSQAALDIQRLFESM